MVKIFCSPFEALVYRYKHSEAELEWAKQICSAYGAEPSKEDSDNLYNFVMDVFNAGRVSGVRQERYRRREAGQEWFPDLQY